MIVCMQCKHGLVYSETQNRWLHIGLRPPVCSNYEFAEAY